MRFDDLKVYDKLVRAVEELGRILDPAELEFALDTYDERNTDYYGPDDEDGPDVDEMLERAREADGTLADAISSIKRFDRQLAKVLVLRGKLAELTGIPMFSHIPESKRYSIREEYNV